MIIFKWYDVEGKENEKKETDFEVKNEDTLSLITSITAYADNIGKVLNPNSNLADTEKELLKYVMQAAFEAGIKEAFGEEKNNANTNSL